jgi:hypothetical protein
MAQKLTFEYDETGVRRSPSSGAVEAVEILFFTRWLLRSKHPDVRDLGDFFAQPRTSGT